MIEPTVVKSAKRNYPDREPVNLKSYTCSNIQKIGTGAEAFRGISNVVKQEIYGAAAVVQFSDK